MNKKEAESRILDAIKNSKGRIKEMKRNKSPSEEIAREKNILDILHFAIIKCKGKEK